ncbi:MAG TPA: hypothetical protein VGG16_27615 [Streptosporangiaceae bacterium]|jgi:hypothetical protein
MPRFLLDITPLRESPQFRRLWLGSTLTFAAALYGIGRLPVLPPVAGISQPALRAVAEGFAFIRRNKVLYGAFLSD